MLQPSADDNLAFLLASHVNTTQAGIATGTPIHPGICVAYLITSRDNLDRLHEAIEGSCTSVPYALCIDYDSVDDFAYLQSATAFLSCNANPNSWCAVQAKSEGLPSIISLKGLIGENHHKQERKVKLIGNDKVSVIVSFKPRYVDVYAKDEVEPNRIYDGDLITIDGSTGRIYAGVCDFDSAVLPELYKHLTEIIVASLSQHGLQTGWHLLDQTNLYHTRKSRIKELLQDNRVSRVLRHISKLPSDHRPAVVGTVHTVPGVIQACVVGCSIMWDQQQDRLVIVPRGDNFGIGLLRTERVFTNQPELNDLRVITLGETVFTRTEVEASLKRFTDFVEGKYKKLMMANSGGLAVTRTLCMPNNKLFPPDFDIDSLSKKYGKESKLVKQAIEASVGESETFHGVRGKRLHMLHEKFAKAEIHAYLNAITNARKKGLKQRFVLLMSMVTLPVEVERFSRWLDEIAYEIRADGEPVPFVELAIMVETTGAYLGLERFCSISNESCALVGFFFGGNDLTAAVLNINRDDSVKKLIPAYQQNGLFEHNPFIRLNDLVIETIAEGSRRIRRVLGDRALIGFGGEQAADY